MRDLIDGLDGIISGGITAMDFGVVAGTDKMRARSILEEITKNDIGHKEGELYMFSDTDRLKVALYIIQKGVSIDDVSEKLSWQDFEGLVAEILEYKDYTTERNYRLKKPKMEIDVIGISSDTAMLIDCKHWKRTSPSALNNIVKKQIERTKHYVSTTGTTAVPVIVTLYQDSINFIQRVPIVPIFQFASFVDEFYGNLDDLQQIKA